MIRSNVNIKGLNIFENEIKLTACVDNTTLFLRDLNSVFELLSLFQIFESWSSLKLDSKKSENLDKETVKILGAHFSYNMSLVDSRNFVETITKMEEILSVWSYRILTLIGRISVFKILALSKILYISSMKIVPKPITEKLDKLQKSFIWKSKKPKIKHSTLIRD